MLRAAKNQNQMLSFDVRSPYPDAWYTPGVVSTKSTTHCQTLVRPRGNRQSESARVPQIPEFSVTRRAPGVIASAAVDASAVSVSASGALVVPTPPMTPSTTGICFANPVAGNARAAAKAAESSIRRDPIAFNVQELEDQGQGQQSRGQSRAEQQAERCGWGNGSMGSQRNGLIIYISEPAIPSVVSPSYIAKRSDSETVR